MSYKDILPYTCVYIDAAFSDFYEASWRCLGVNQNREDIISDLRKIWERKHNQNTAIPFMSVRSGLTTYLEVMNFPRGSEIIVSAINIPDMITILHDYGLKVVSLDVSLDTLTPKLELLESLISERTRALLLAHLYGRTFDLTPFAEFAHSRGLALIEDAAEAFSGYDYIGHPQSDIALFSFGAIKFYTCFGGAVAKIRDPAIAVAMETLHRTYPVQAHSTYLKKIAKYSLVYCLLNCPRIVQPAMFFTRSIGIDHKKYVVKFLRGFPERMVQQIRAQPSTALLATMRRRLSRVDLADLNMAAVKGAYVSDRLPDDVTQLGTKSDQKRFWLYPILVENPDEVVKALYAMGIDAYRGATQLNIVEPDNGDNHLKHLHTFATRYPHEAKFVMDHVVYLPVNKTVPYEDLDRIVGAVEAAVRSTSSQRLRPLRHKLQAKL